MCFVGVIVASKIGIYIYFFYSFFLNFIQFISFFEVIFYHLFHLLVGYFAHIISELFKKGSPLVFANLELYPFTPLSLGMKSLLSQKNFFGEIFGF